MAGPFAGYMVDSFGRRMTALIISIPFLLAWLTIAFAPTMLVLISARFVTGMLMGLYEILACLIINT